MVIDWFNARDVVALAEEITREIERLFPLDQKRSTSRHPAKEQKKFENLLAKVHSRAMKLPLNIYKKARFLNTVKWKLRDAGYDPKFISDVVALLVPSLNT